MTLVESGANQIIGQFGVTVRVYSQDGQSPQDNSDPVLFENTDNDSNYTEHKVRLYTSASQEMLEDYGLDEDTESMMYSTDDIADEADKVKYPPGNYEWTVKRKMTNQISDNGPYIFVYSMEGL